jgi:hypothetical protein
LQSIWRPEHECQGQSRLPMLARRAPRAEDGDTECSELTRTTSLRGDRGYGQAMRWGRLQGAGWRRTLSIASDCSMGAIVRIAPAHRGYTARSISLRPAARAEVGEARVGKRGAPENTERFSETPQTGLSVSAPYHSPRGVSGGERRRSRRGPGRSYGTCHLEWLLVMIGLCNATIVAK